jgi:hypothetical protein
MRVVRDELAREIHVEPHLHSDRVTHGIDARSLWSNIEASVIQQGMHPCSRGASSPSLFRMDHPPDDRGCREGRELASPMARLQQKNAGGRYHRFGRGHPDLPCATVLRFIRALPGDRLSCPRRLPTMRQHHRKTWHQLRDARTTRLHRRTGSFVRTRTPRCDPTRPPHPAPDVRDDREAPPQWDGMRRVKHVF